jgi:hypothetical protein
MIWRESYTTRILVDPNVPVLSSVGGGEGPAIIAASFATHSIIEQGVWWRLFQSDFRSFSSRFLVFVQENDEKLDKEEIDAIVAVSDHEKIRYVEDLDQNLRRLCGTAEKTRGFAAIVTQNSVPLIMIGPPTEDAWEQFSNVLKDLLA